MHPSQMFTPARTAITAGSTYSDPMSRSLAQPTVQNPRAATLPVRFLLETKAEIPDKPMQAETTKRAANRSMRAPAARRKLGDTIVISVA